MQWHPDKNHNSVESNTKFQQINTAYNTLKNKQLTSENSLVSMNDLTAPNSSTMFSMFSKLFEDAVKKEGNASSLSVSAAQPILVTKESLSLSYSITIDMNTVINGGIIPLKIERKVATTSTSFDLEQETIYVSVQQGVDDNEMVLVKNKGNIALDGTCGIVKIFVKIDNNTEYIRKGLDLILHKTISLKDALSGFTIQIKHLNGKTFTLHNKRGNIVTPGYQRVIPKLGICRISPPISHTGNLIIIFNVEFPLSLTDVQCSTINSLF